MDTQLQNSNNGFRMSISIDYEGCYTNQKEFFDAMAQGLQAVGHRVGIITGMREKDVYTGEDIKSKITNHLGFKPDFIHMWGQTETIGNGDLWKVQKMDQENVLVHFDDNPIGMKRFTGRWVMKTFTNEELKALSGQVDPGSGMA